MFYEEIFKEFSKRKIKYLVVGGLAVNLHGIPRMTQDMDIIVNMGEDNLKKILEGLEALGYKPRLPVKPASLLDPKVRSEWIQSRNLKAFTFVHKGNPAQEVDILLVSPLNFDDAYARKTVKHAGDININLVNISDLILMKEGLGRTTDDYDVKMLRTLRRMEKNK
jgi:hypothetical protein